MELKNLPIWLKGGIIGLILFLVWEVFVFFSTDEPFKSWLLVGSFIYVLIPLFILGALIGWIVGKIKSKKQ